MLFDLQSDSDEIHCHSGSLIPVLSYVRYRYYGIININHFKGQILLY